MVSYNQLARNPYRKNIVMKRSLGRKRRMPMVRYRQPRNKMEPGSQLHQARIEVSLPLYIFSATGPVFSYSFSTSATVLNATMLSNSSLSTNQELIRNANLYAYAKVCGVSIKFTRTLNAAVNTVYQLPGLSVNVMGALSAAQLTGLTKEDVYQSDGSMEIQVLNSIDKPISKYWGFKETFVTAGFSESLGTYVNTANLPTVNALIGFQQNPSQSDITNSPKIGDLDCTIYITYCKRITLNNL